MSRINPKPSNQYPWYLRLLFWFQKRRYTAALQSSLIWGRSPSVYLAFRGFAKALDREGSPLQPELRALIAARVAQVRHSAFCMDISSWVALRHGVSEKKLLELTSSQYSPLYSPKERVALRYTEALSLSDTVTDQVFNDLKEQFTDDEIVELTATICFHCMSNKFNSVLDIPSHGFMQGATESRGLLHAIINPAPDAAEPGVSRCDRKQE